MEGWTGVAGKRVLVTGATHGIGLAAARELAKRGAELAIVARDAARGEAAACQIAAAGGTAHADVLHADLTSQRDIHELAREALRRYPRIDVLINNAGAVFGRRSVTVDGIETTWALNHLAPFLLTALLLGRLKESAPARIVTTTSDAHKNHTIPFDDINAERGYRARGFTRYGETKLANILFTRELARRIRGTGVTANCVHPGLVASGFNRNNGALMSFGMLLVRPFARSPRRGADGLVWLADAPAVGAQSGGYFEDRRLATPSKPAQDDEAAARLWGVSEEQTHQLVSG
ncbi:MAG: SDR family oxidoreductase [Candidatus Dormibacteraeota bacterium]|nr:SDR family oxidoreductase [Candidatus Dormibacteraeota bacterium]